MLGLISLKSLGKLANLQFRLFISQEHKIIRINLNFKLLVMAVIVHIKLE